MVKLYLRYVYSSQFGVLNSSTCNPVFDKSDQHVITACNEYLTKWNPRTIEYEYSISTTSKENGKIPIPITCIEQHPQDNEIVAIGLSTGIVSIWNTQNMSLVVSFEGHKSRISKLEFNLTGSLLASGSCDTDIIIWDVIAQMGLYRLSGHKHDITGILWIYPKCSKDEIDQMFFFNNFLDQEDNDLVLSQQGAAAKKKKKKRKVLDNILSTDASPNLTFTILHCAPHAMITSSKDYTIKIWDLSTQWCIKTLFLPSEIFSMALNPCQVILNTIYYVNTFSSQTKLVVACNDGQLRLYSLATNYTIQNDFNVDIDARKDIITLDPLGMISRPTKKGHLAQLRFFIDLDHFITEVAKYPHIQLLLNIRSNSISNVTTKSGTLLTTNKYQIAQNDINIVLAGLNHSNKNLEVYRLLDTQRQKKRKEKRIRRILQSLKKKIAKKDKINKLCNDIETKNIETNKVNLPTIYNSDYEILKSKLDSLILETNELEKDSHIDYSVYDEFQYVISLYLSIKPVSFDFYPLTSRLLISYSNNTFEIFEFPLKPIQSIKPTLLNLDKASLGNEDSNAQLHLKELNLNVSLGNNDSIKNIGISHDDGVIFVLNEQTINLYNTDSTKRICHINVNEIILCGFIVAGNLYMVLGTKEGSLVLVNIVACHVVEIQRGIHSGPIKCITETPSKDGFITGSEDRSLKCFNFFFKKKKKTEITFEMINDCEVADQILDIKCTPDSKYVAVALLNFTIQVFYRDTLKLFLTLYGHKLPCTSIDISDDSYLLVSGSFDKTIKVWGLDFGNIHCTWIAHEDINRVVFLKNTHYVVSSGVNGVLKMWDVDTRELLYQIGGHTKSITHLITTRLDSDRLDQSIRIWKRTDEQLYAEEERGIQLDIQIEEQACTNMSNHVVFAKPTKQSVESFRTTEKLIEAIDLCSKASEDIINYKEACKTWEKCFKMNSLNIPEKNLAAFKPMPPKPQLNLVGWSSNHYIFNVIKNIPSSVYQEVILALSFPYALKILSYIAETFNSIIHTDTDADIFNYSAIESIARIVLLIVHIHMRQFLLFPSHLNDLIKIHKYLRLYLQNQKDKLEFNIASLKLFQKKINENKIVSL